MARILQAREQPDGRWVLAVVGVHRLRVERWLPDDPYPRAEIEVWPDEPEDRHTDGADGTSGSGEGTSRDIIVMLLRRAAALSRELGRSAPPLDLELADDPVIASYQAVAVAPLGQADQQRLLATTTVASRWAILHSLLVDQIELLQAQLGPR